MVQYEPPEKLTPGECGALLDNEVAMRGITATMVDLSVRGYLEIEGRDNGKLADPKDNGCRSTVQPRSPVPGAHVSDQAR